MVLIDEEVVCGEKGVYMGKWEEVVMVCEQLDQCVVLLCVALVVLCHFICLKGVSVSKDKSGGGENSPGPLKKEQRDVWVNCCFN